MRKIYEVINNDSEVVFTGTSQEVADKYNLTIKQVFQNAYTTKIGRKVKIAGEYQIRNIGAPACPPPVPRARIKVKKEVEKPLKSPFDIAVWALKTFGNTSVDFDPYPKLLPDMMEIYGLDCSVQQKIEYPEKKRVSQRGRKKQPKVHWYVEVKYAIREGACI